MTEYHAAIRAEARKLAAMSIRERMRRLGSEYVEPEPTRICTFCQQKITGTPRFGNTNEHTRDAVFCDELCEQDFVDMWDERDSNPYSGIEGYIDG